MRARYNTKGTVSFVAIVEMEAQCQHAIQYGDWRLDEQFAFLFRPTLTSGAFDTLGDGNAQILVKRHQPVILD
jgi:hypothetical protein